jgi:chromosome segregation ATPase
MKNMNIRLLLLLSLIIFQGNVWAKLYKWVDEDGKVHYSDKVPPEYNDQARQELNKTGVIKDSVERALTPEEKKQKAEELARQQREAERLEALKKKQQAERNKLLKSYSNADQITRLKRERIDALERNIELAEENLVIQKRNLNDLLKRAADKERSGGVVSDAFTAQIEKSREQIENQQLFIVDKNEEIKATEEKYNDELAKYLYYTGQTSSIEPIDSKEHNEQAESSDDSDE